jgi:hypothetical protein
LVVVVITKGSLKNESVRAPDCLLLAAYTNPALECSDPLCLTMCLWVSKSSTWILMDDDTILIRKKIPTNGMKYDMGLLSCILDKRK